MTRPRYQARTVTPLPAWGTAEAPPTEFCLFVLGQTMSATWWGGKREQFVLTKAGADAIITEWSRRNIEGSFDRDHDFGDSRGTFDIELRADGLWVSSIQWTAETLQKFKEKKLRYYSPTFDVEYSAKGEPIRDPEGRLKICTLINIALTNYPATDNLRPLIALAQQGARWRCKMTPDQARAMAPKVIEACKGDASFVDSVALLLLSDPEETPMGEEPSVDPMMEQAAKENEVIANSARQLTGQTGKAVLGGLQALAQARVELDAARAELAQFKHTAAVELAIKEKKLSPAKKDEALKQDPQFFAGFIALASPIVDVVELSAKTNANQAGPTVESLAANPKLLAYCEKTGTDHKEYAAGWVKNYPGVEFDL